MSRAQAVKMGIIRHDRRGESGLQRFGLDRLDDSRGQRGCEK
jgi:hypothetical protein